MMKRTTEDIVIDVIVFIIMITVFIATVYPFYYCLVISFNEGIDASRGGIFCGRESSHLKTTKQYFPMSNFYQGLE